MDVVVRFIAEKMLDFLSKTISMVTHERLQLVPLSRPVPLLHQVDFKTTRLEVPMEQHLPPASAEHRVI